jgi:predicted nicotinamide N-methyase
VEGSDHHLILPALREPKIQIRLENSTEVIEIEQDGLLNLYDVSGVLWPAGYLLGLCLSNPVKCGVGEIFKAMSYVTQPQVLELGTGVGFAAIALSKTMRDDSNSPSVIATDVSKSALDLTVTNAYRNGVGEMIVAIEADYRDVDSLLELKKTINLSRDNTSKQDQQGFDIIIGSSLQSLFDGTQDDNSPLWLTLDTLLSKSNPSAIVILSHVRSGSERIQVPKGTIPFELVRRIPGDRFYMKTRDGNNSDFELIVLRRRQVQ